MLFIHMLHHRKKNRLEKFLYCNWYFFITINSHNSIKYFWEIINNEIILNKYWKIIQECWLWLSKQYNYVTLDEYIIMPNHFHGIVMIDNDKNISNTVRNGRDRSLQKTKWLSSIIGAFKTISSKQLHQSWLIDFARQKSFYDHIIRNQQDFERIQEYIQNNPYKRQNDEYHI